MATLGEFVGSGANTTKLLLHLNGNSADSSGNGNNGTDTAITYSQSNGRFGMGAGFNGSTSKIAYASSASLTPQTFTIGAWVKLNSTSNFPIWGGDNVVGGITVKAGGYGAVDKSNIANLVTGVKAYTAGVWTHLMATYNSSTDLCVLYKDGEYDNSATSNQTFTQTNQAVGRNNAEWANGSIDEFIMENRVWTASEVKKYYTYAKGRFNN